MASHQFHPDLLRRQVRVAVIGAGGTGSQLMNNLARLHLALLALGHPGGLHVTLWDDDVVSAANVGRQSFYPVDIGAAKASTIVNRLNLGFQLNWSSRVRRIDAGSDLDRADIIIGCVDNRKARLAILKAADRNRVLYWLDCGNRLGDGQVVLGEVCPLRAKQRKELRLPHAADLYPELIDPSLDAEDDVPSCSLADALEKQALFINTLVAMFACNVLTELFRHGQITYHGVFVNLKSGRTSPLQVSEDVWKRFGYAVPAAKKRAPRAKKKPQGQPAEA
ncbi:PRTRC system ThiF family protein [Noviherbaspirillum pedocola]|uniref:PRTRC system ThiF family protein n=1 Tax=Noviherbaspirillum pedocola TaxID=2801341 RepID=A0A934W3X7_9BURK|nr:PRTRC system ThiF family protein [Noviherbaspirillum pedocola]MBK4737906.1 PRTRC system ThiF family protein [Noviherbaspirillum pedocola]